MEFKVKEVTGTEEKSQQEIEAKLLKDAEEKHNPTNVEQIDMQPSDSTSDDTQDTVEMQDNVETQSSELNEDDVLSFIKNRYEKDFTSVDQLFEQREKNEELPEDVKGYFDYKKSTGRGIEDYVKLNRDFSSMDEDQLLSEYLLASGEATDSEDVEVLMDDYSYDEDLDEERDIKKTKLAKKKAIAKAKNFFEEQKEMYKQPLESSTVGVSDEQMQEIEEYKRYLAEADTAQEEMKRKREWFTEKTDQVFQDFKGFDFKVGEDTFTFNPGEAERIKEQQMDYQGFVRKFIDKDTGMLSDAAGYHRALAVAMNPNKFASFFYEQGKSDATESVTRRMKNVDMTERKAPQVSNRKDGLQIKSISTPSSRGLRIKSNK
tara:strand:+ start:1663 stop:2787 length:1125 start_codon:yes stop_codon:yes gene_type:complete